MLLKDTLHFWLWRWLHLNSTWTMCKDALAEFMTLAHLIFVRSATFFSRPQHLRGQFDILTLPIWTFDRATKKLRAYMMYWSIRPPPAPISYSSQPQPLHPHDRWSKWQWRCSSGAPDIHVNVFNTSNLKITPSSTRRQGTFQTVSNPLPLRGCHLICKNLLCHSVPLYIQGGIQRLDTAHETSFPHGRVHMGTFNKVLLWKTYFS